MKPDPKAYWRANLRVIVECLTIWFITAFLGGIVFVDTLNQLQWGGYPLGFWLAQQGAIYIFVGLVFFYAHRMNQLDKRYGVDEEDEPS